MSFNLAIVTSSVGPIITLLTHCFDFFTPPKSEKIAEREERKRQNRSRQFSRITIRPERCSERLPGVADSAFDSDSSFFAAFSSHAIHKATPVPRAGLPNKRLTRKLTPPRSTTDRATTNFHSNDMYRVKFSGVSVLKGNSQIEDIATIIFNDVIRPYTSDRNNETTIVVSEIGCGKSTLLTNLLYRINYHQASQISKRRPQTQAVEVAILSFDSLDFSKSVNIYNFIEQTVKPWILTQIKSQTNLDGDTFEAVFSGARIENVVLIFDDMDGVYRTICRDLILHQDTVDSQQGVKQFFPFVLALVQAFTSGELSQYGIRCVFALRHDTLQMLRASSGPTVGGTSVFRNLRGLYNLDDKPGHQVVELVKKRLQLASSVEPDATQRQVIDTRISDLDSLAPDFDFVSQIAVQGLRHTLHLIQQLDWCLLNKDAFERFFSRPRFLTLFFLSGGYRHYSQVNEGVTNIFLVNSSYRRDNNPPLIDGKAAFSDRYLGNHKQTYFLKFLVLCLVGKTRADHSDIVELFSKTGNYEREVTELVLFSLCEVKHGRLVRPLLDFSDDGSIKSNGLSVTSRGAYYLKTDMFWSFSYLAMVSEDHWLEVPNDIAEYFKNPRGVIFLGEVNDTSFVRLYSDFLMEKARTVPIVISLLEAAFESEKKANRDLYRTLKKRGVEFPSFQRIRNRCREELIELLSDCEIVEHKQILDCFDHWISEKMQAKIRKIVKSSLRGCH